MSGAVDTKGGPAFEGWAVLELMGHRRLGGYVREVVLAGEGMLRVEMPEDDAGKALTQFYSPKAVYCITPSSEATARAALRLSRPEPVSQWDMERAQELLLGTGKSGERRCNRCGRNWDEGVNEWALDEEDNVTGNCGPCQDQIDLEESNADGAGEAHEASLNSQADGHHDEPETGDPGV